MLVASGKTLKLFKISDEMTLEAELIHVYIVYFFNFL